MLGVMDDISLMVLNNDVEKTAAEKKRNSWYFSLLCLEKLSSRKIR